LLFTGLKINVLWFFEAVLKKGGHLFVELKNSEFWLDFRRNRMFYFPTFPKNSVDDLALEILVAFFGMPDYNVVSHAGGRKIKWENLNTLKEGTWEKKLASGHGSGLRS
jgi:hypothetical protein